ncbi:MAG: ORF6N domain-containing protein [Candidatus Saganbacteria bacterium]|nr:ORF6N domain-containing protein [Candidatus Saganbacteria bacterium]
MKKDDKSIRGACTERAPASRSVEKSGSKSLVPAEIIENMILLIRGQKVMLDKDLADLYGVETKYLKRAVKRNIFRFPDDFMIRLSIDEQKALRCHFGALERGKHSKYLMYAFTEQGIAMLSSVLNSKRAVLVNIQVMRTFTKLRTMLSGYKELRNKIEEMEKKYDGQFKIVFDALREMLHEKEKPKGRFGFI